MTSRLSIPAAIAALLGAVLIAPLPALAQTAPATQAPATQAAPAAATGTPIRPIRASKIILVGDSTTAVAGGWGPSFCAKHVSSFVACVNLARGGRSSGSYRAEGSWDIALAEMSSVTPAGAPAYAETYVLIQFGHNDQPGKPGRSTDLVTEFPVNLRLYVEETRARGAIPILLTPLTRRQFVDGQLQRDLTAWADSIRKVAAETNTPLIDLNAHSADAVQALGPVLSAKFAMARPIPEVAAALLTGTTIPAAGSVPPPPAATSTAPAAAPTTTQTAATQNAALEPFGPPLPNFDYTHLGEVGADFFAAMVTRDLALAAPDLRRGLIP
jgi:lysophospholipase L1-like esterase